MCQICSVVGKSLCSVPTHEPTIRCALSPPSISSEYRRQHDEDILNTARTLLGEILGTVDAVEDARTLSSLPMRMGGLSLRSAERCAHAAYWRVLADTSHMIAQRNLAVAEMVCAVHVRRHQRDFG